MCREELLAELKLLQKQLYRGVNTSLQEHSLKCKIHEIEMKLKG